MSPLVEDVLAWLRKAEADLRAGDRERLHPEDELWSDIAFHAQQAIEKSWKAFLTAHDVAFGKTHNLEQLGRACAGLDQSLGALIITVTPLTEFAWRFRYPGTGQDATREVAEDALIIAHTLYREIRSRLSVYLLDS